MAEEIKKEKAEKEVETASEKKIGTSFKPKFFMGKEEKIECVVTGYYNKESGMLEFCVPGENQSEVEKFNVVKHVFSFKRVPYDRLNNYRSQSMVYNPSDQSNSVNLLKLREYLWLFHLTDWNYTDEEGNKIELKHDPNGALADESLDLLYQIPASILDTAMGLFERRINIA